MVENPKEKKSNLHLYIKNVYSPVKNRSVLKKVA